jgi:hypothetical protein
LILGVEPDAAPRGTSLGVLLWLAAGTAIGPWSRRFARAAPTRRCRPSTPMRGIEIACEQEHRKITERLEAAAAHSTA